MKFAASMLLALLWQATPRVAPEPPHFRFERTIQVPAGTTGRACAALDGTVYAHSPALTDIRLYRGANAQEVPYALLTSQATAASESAKVLNLGERAGKIVFDLEMPARAFSTVHLNLTGQNFLATAIVTGQRSAGAMTCCGGGTQLGTFTLFDLTAQHFGRSTSLALAEANFPYLHVELEAKAAPGHPGFVASPAMVQGAEIPPSREAQIIYTTVAETTQITQYNQDSQLAMMADGMERMSQPLRRTVALFEVPAHVPVERVSFEIEPGDKTNFSRSVVIQAMTKANSNQIAHVEVVNGEISRVRMTSGSRDIREENLSVPAVLGSNAQDPMTVQVIVTNGDDKPLAIHAVKLQMRQRKLCFDATAEPVTMYYGDDQLVAPMYDYSRLFQPSDASTPAKLDPEEPNPNFVPRADGRSLTDKHPELLWVALMVVVFVLGVVAMRSAKRVTGQNH